MIRPLESEADSQLPSTDGLLDHISASTVKFYLTCPLKFWFKKVLLLPEPVSPALHLGKAVHAGLQCFHKARWRGQPHDRETVQRAFSEAYNAPEEAAMYPDTEAKAAHARRKESRL